MAIISVKLPLYFRCLQLDFVRIVVITIIK